MDLVKIARLAVARIAPLGLDLEPRRARLAHQTQANRGIAQRGVLHLGDDSLEQIDANLDITSRRDQQRGLRHQPLGAIQPNLGRLRQHSHAPGAGRHLVAVVDGVDLPRRGSACQPLDGAAGQRITGRRIDGAIALRHDLPHRAQGSQDIGIARAPSHGLAINRLDCRDDQFAAILDVTVPQQMVAQPLDPRFESALNFVDFGRLPDMPGNDQMLVVMLGFFRLVAVVIALGLETRSRNRAHS